MKGRNGGLRRGPSVAIADLTIDHCRTKEYDGENESVLQELRDTNRNSTRGESKISVNACIIL
jgi:hypothetical protein